MSHIYVTLDFFLLLGLITINRNVSTDHMVNMSIIRVAFHTFIVSRCYDKEQVKKCFIHFTHFPGLAALPSMTYDVDRVIHLSQFQVANQWTTPPAHQ